MWMGGELHESHGHGMDVHVPVLDANDRLAERNRGFCCKKPFGYVCFSSPGSGKTSLLQKTAEMLRGRVRMGVIVGFGDDNDAERLSRADIPIRKEITTGTMYAWIHMIAGGHEENASGRSRRFDY